MTQNKLDMATAREIRRLHSEEGVGAPELAKRYGVAVRTIYQVLRGETWREFIVTLRPTRRRTALSDEEVAEIKRLRSSGLSMERVGFIVGVSAPTVGKALKSP